jgi:hypothetical protein
VGTGDFNGDGKLDILWNNSNTGDVWEMNGAQVAVNAQVVTGAKSWNIDRRACARIEATTKGLDIRFVVTSIETGSAEHIYETLYCARGQAENLIKLHKAQLASDRTSCRSPLANRPARRPA